MSAVRDVASRPPVVVACAEGDAAALTPVMRGLVQRGMRVDLVPTAEGDVQGLETAVEQFGPTATYVLCRTEGIDHYHAEQCELTIRAGEVPSERVLSVEFDGDADAFVETICQAIDKKVPTAPSRSAPQVVVHTSAPDPSVERVAESASSTRVAMRAALGWRRWIKPVVYGLVALGLTSAAVVFGWDAFAG